MPARNDISHAISLISTKMLTLQQDTRCGSLTWRYTHDKIIYAPNN